MDECMCNKLLNITNIMKEVVKKSVLLLNNKDLICHHTTFLLADTKQLHVLATYMKEPSSVHMYQEI